jgi:hypothetical protein
MRRTLTTFLLLLVLFTCAFLIIKTYQPFINRMPVTDVNNMIFTDYNLHRDQIEKYRLGVPRFEGYIDPSKVRPDWPKPKPFILDYPQPINGIVPADYPSTLDPTNVMFPDMDNLGCKDNCMDMQKGYYDNILNDEAQSSVLFLDLQQ